MFSAPLLFRAHFSIPAFLFGSSDLVMLIWADGFLGVVCWGGAIGSWHVDACLGMIAVDCMSMLLRARFWLWWFLAGCALCGRLIRSLACL